MHTFKIFKKWLYFEPYGLSSTPTSQDAQFHLKNTSKFIHNTSPCCIHTLGLTMISMCRVLSSTTRLMASRLIHKLLVLKILWKNNRLYMKNCCLMLVEGWWLCYDCMTGYLLKFADTFKFIYLKAELNSFNSYKQLCTNYKLFHKKSFKLLHSVIFILYVHNVPMIFKGAWSISA